MLEAANQSAAKKGMGSKRGSNAHMLKEKYIDLSRINGSKSIAANALAKLGHAVTLIKRIKKKQGIDGSDMKGKKRKKSKSPMALNGIEGEYLSPKDLLTPPDGAKGVLLTPPDGARGVQGKMSPPPSELSPALHVNNRVSKQFLNKLEPLPEIERSNHTRETQRSGDEEADDLLLFSMRDEFDSNNTETARKVGAFDNTTKGSTVYSPHGDTLYGGFGETDMRVSTPFERKTASRKERITSAEIQEIARTISR